MSNELAPCPFCGSDVTPPLDPAEPVTCRACGARGPLPTVAVTTVKLPTWNQRAEQWQPVEAAVIRCECGNNGCARAVSVSLDVVAYGIATCNDISDPEAMWHYVCLPSDIRLCKRSD